jgi:DAHP synthetase family protein
MLAEAKAATGLPIVTEVLDTRDVELVCAVADVIQVGARNMHNSALLTELGMTDRPILLKRGLAATIAETIEAAGYIRQGGNERIVLCERGMRTFETAYRFTLDLTAVPILQERSGLPVFVDPSHGPGRRDLVTRLSKAAAAVGADGLIVEVDENPDLALSDGPQQLHAADFAAYLDAVNRVAAGHLLRQPRHDIFKITGVMRAGPRPRHRLKVHAAVRALQAPQLALNHAAVGAEVQVAPALDAPVVNREMAARLPATRANTSPAAQPDRDHGALAAKNNIDDRCSGQAEHPVECGLDTHARPPPRAVELQQPAACIEDSGVSLALCATSDGILSSESPCSRG